MSIAAALRQTELSQAAAAANAIDDGWDVSAPWEVDTTDLVKTCQIRILNLQRQVGDHASALAKSMMEFLENVSSDRKLQVRLISGTAEHQFLIYEDAVSGGVLGCFRIISQLHVSPQRWQELWNAVV